MNTSKIIYLNCWKRHEDVIDHRSYAPYLSSCEIKSWKNSGLNGIRTHNLCDAGAVLYQQNYQANWELVTLWVRNTPINNEGCKLIYERSYILTAKDMKTWFFSSGFNFTTAYGVSTTAMISHSPLFWGYLKFSDSGSVLGFHVTSSFSKNWK